MYWIIIFIISLACLSDWERKKLIIFAVTNKPILDQRCTCSYILIVMKSTVLVFVIISGFYSKGWMVEGLFENRQVNSRFKIINFNLTNRGYYMVAGRYEISLRIRSAHSWNIFQLENIILASPNGHVMFSLLHKHWWKSKNISLSLQKAQFFCPYSF